MNAYVLPGLRLKGHASRSKGASCFAWDDATGLLAVALKRRWVGQAALCAHDVAASQQLPCVLHSPRLRPAPTTLQPASPPRVLPSPQAAACDAAQCCLGHGVAATNCGLRLLTLPVTPTPLLACPWTTCGAVIVHPAPAACRLRLCAGCCYVQAAPMCRLLLFQYDALPAVASICWPCLYTPPSPYSLAHGAGCCCISTMGWNLCRCGRRRCQMHRTAWR